MHLYATRICGELPAWDERRNLILCPLQYNGAFVELFYASFAIVKQVLLEDAKVPPPWVLHGSDDRFIAKELFGDHYRPTRRS